MARKRFVDPFELLIRREGIEKILRFFVRAEERCTFAFPQASRVLEGGAPSAKQVRGAARRHYLNQALQSAATDVGLPLDVRFTDPPTWSFPTVRAGAFTLTIGIVETRFRGAPRSLRTRSKYLQAICARNAIADPQSDLLDRIDTTHAVVPDGSLGGLIVAQFDRNEPEKPAFLGFWVPSANLKDPFYVRSFDEIIGMLRQRLSMSKRTEKRKVERRPLRKRKDGSDSGLSKA